MSVVSEVVVDYMDDTPENRAEGEQLARAKGATTVEFLTSYSMYSDSTRLRVVGRICT